MGLNFSLEWFLWGLVTLHLKELASIVWLIWPQSSLAAVLKGPFHASKGTDCIRFSPISWTCPGVSWTMTRSDQSWGLLSHPCSSEVVMSTLNSSEQVLGKGGKIQPNRKPHWVAVPTCLLWALCLESTVQYCCFWSWSCGGVFWETYAFPFCFLSSHQCFGPSPVFIVCLLGPRHGN
jgi:hypothetical protein